MMKGKGVLWLLLFGVIFISFGQHSDTECDKNDKFIKITGVAKQSVIPNEIYVEITIKERYEGKEKITIAKQEEGLLEALAEINVSTNNLSLLNANSKYTKINWAKQDVVTKSEYVLKLKDAVEVKNAFRKLDDLHIVDARITRISHSEIVAYSKEVRIMAIKSAKEKADYLLGAIGEQAGKPVLVKEEGFTQEGLVFEKYQAQRKYSKTANKFSPRWENKPFDKSKLAFQRIILSSSVYVVFEIK